MKLGFTGSQAGPQSREQSYTVIELLAEFYTEGSELHHGKCIGWDDKAARIGKVLGYYLAEHPPTDTSKICRVVSDFKYSPLPYLERNHQIVDATQLLIAAPHTKYSEAERGQPFASQQSGASPASSYGRTAMLHCFTEPFPLGELVRFDLELHRLRNRTLRLSGGSACGH